MKKREVTRTLQTPGKLFVRESAPGEAPSRKICGYAIMFNVESVVLYQEGKYEEREVIEPCAISKEFLDGCDIKMTMYHNRQIVLARSNKGKGTLTYGIDQKGVYFEFDAPRTQHGDEAIELVKRGDLCGCSFIFTTYYDDKNWVSQTEKVVNGVTQVTYHVRKMLGIYDFTIAADPAYPDTSIEARERQQEAMARAEKVATERAERERFAADLRETARMANDPFERSQEPPTAKELREIAETTK